MGEREVEEEGEMDRTAGRLGGRDNAVTGSGRGAAAGGGRDGAFVAAEGEGVGGRGGECEEEEGGCEEGGGGGRYEERIVRIAPRPRAQQQRDELEVSSFYCA